MEVMKQLFLKLLDSAEKNIRYLLPMFIVAATMMNEKTNYFEWTIFGFLATVTYIGVLIRIINWNLKRSTSKTIFIYEILLFTLFVSCYVSELLAEAEINIPRITISTLWIIAIVSLAAYIFITKRKFLKKLGELL